MTHDIPYNNLDLKVGDTINTTEKHIVITQGVISFEEGYLYFERTNKFSNKTTSFIMGAEEIKALKEFISTL